MKSLRHLRTNLDQTYKVPPDLPGRTGSGQEGRVRLKAQFIVETRGTTSTSFNSVCTHSIRRTATSG